MAANAPSSRPHQEILLKVENITKRYPLVLANDNISFEIRRGEICSLLGENGAGKSTLAEILCGACRPDSGTISFGGKPTAFASPRDAIAAGVGMVHQHFTLVPTLSAVENIFIGTKSTGILLDLKPTTRRLEELCAAYEVELDLHAKVSQLSVDKQQWVEILKALFGGIQLLILDEPTAALTPQESRKLYANLQKMRSEGLSIICITHKLEEVIDASDRVIVLRNGKLVDAIETAATNKEALARMMVGRDVMFRVDNKRKEPGEALLEVDDLTAYNDRGHAALRGVSFTVRRGEVLAVAGVSGNGQKELFDVLVGVRQAAGGRIALDRKDITNRPTTFSRGHGIGSIPADRIHQGLVMDFRVDENLILGRHWDSRFTRWSFLSQGKIAAFAETMIRDYEIVPPSASQAVRALSGGNLQKVIIARELSQEPKCLLVNQPTRGLDVGATEYAHRRLLQERDRGAGILLISEDLAEILSLATRIAVIFRGQIVGMMDGGEASIDEIGLLMAGIHRGAPRRLQ